MNGDEKILENNDECDNDECDNEYDEYDDDDDNIDECEQNSVDEEEEFDSDETLTSENSRDLFEITLFDFFSSLTDFAINFNYVHKHHRDFFNVDSAASDEMINLVVIGDKLAEIYSLCEPLRKHNK